MSTIPDQIGLVSCPEIYPLAAPTAPPVPTWQNGQTERFYHPELDAIRFFLFCGVWSYHSLPLQVDPYREHHVPAAVASLLTIFVKSCMCSLDVFFILSAFLITELLLRERDLRGTVDLKRFYARRLLRIWPLYFFVIGIATVLPLFDRSQRVGWMYLASFLLMSGNWMMSLRGSLGGTILTPLWSVSFEEQFYLLWPLVVGKASRSTIAKIALGLLAVAAFARLILLREHQSGNSIWYNTFARFDSLALGILLAVILHGRARPRFRLPTRLALLAGGIFAWMVVGHWCGLLDPIPGLMGGMIGYPLMSLGGAAIFLCVLGAAQDGFTFMRNSGLVYLGKISYGLYAYHILAQRLSIYLFRGSHPLHGWTLYLFCSLAITFLLAILSFQWLESPFLRLKRLKFTHIPSGPVS